MATLPASDIQALAHLARLTLSSDEEQMFTRQLGDILNYIDQLQSVDVTSVDPYVCAHANAVQLRDDIADVPIDREAVLAASAHVIDNMVAVPRFVEGG